MIEFKNHLYSGFETLNIKISDDQIELMAVHAKELMFWNQKINITAINNPLQIAEKHFMDSIAAASFIKNKSCLLDLGSGGGFPGIPIKIINPLLNVVLIDASLKKINFLKHVIRRLGLKGIKAVNARVQDLQGKTDYKTRFDAVISRAFTNLSDFSELASPFLNRTGTIYAMKGKNAEKEMTHEVMEKFNVKKEYYQLPFEKSDRYVITLDRRI